MKTKKAKVATADFKTIETPDNSFLGVCAGIAYYFGFSLFFTRMFVLIMAFSGFGSSVIFIYIITSWIADKHEKLPADFAERTA